ncbi:MAG: TonB-dependent receptor [Bacteroidota bacterium]|nr:TonB-dependent receptor [Bacteroidota bacterium]
MKQILPFLISCLLTSLAFGQGKILRGFVYEKDGGAPIPYANIIIEEHRLGATTDFNGYFQISDVPVGLKKITVSYLGYEINQVEARIFKNKPASIKVYLEESVEVLNTVDINVARLQRKIKVNTAVVSLNPKNIETFSAGGDPDLMKALAVLPGVVTTGDQGGQLYIRGGAPIQNLVLLDGMIIYNPFHSIGFFSVFDTDVLQEAKVYTAGFGAQYGSRNSSVMDINTRDGNRSKIKAKSYTSTYMSKLLMEAPIGKKDANGIANNSLFISGKTSYLQQVAPIFYPYVETQFGGLPFTFNDIYGKFTTQNLSGSKMSTKAFKFSDAVMLDSAQGIQWNSSGYGVNFLVVPPASATLIEGDFAQSFYFIESTENLNQPRSSSINGFNGGLNFTYFLHKSDEIKYGIDLIGYNTRFNFTNSLGLKLDQEENTTELGGYFNYRKVTPLLILEPGIRLHYYGSQSELSIEPRLGVKYNFTEDFRFKASGGRYSQNLVAANSDRDVVNLFYGFLSGSTDLPTSFRDRPINSKLQKAVHGVAGFEYDIGKYWDINLESYLKDFSQITNINRNKLYKDIPVYSDRPEILRKDFIVERGLAYGYDAVVKYERGRYYLWAVYAWSKVTRDDGVQVYNPNFDRRHNINFVGNAKLGRNKKWFLSVRWNLGTGFPFTPTQGYYPGINFLDDLGNPDIDFDYTTVNGDPSVLYGNLNSKRLPTYHRLDASLKYTTMLEPGTIELTFGATNIYDRENIFFYDRVAAERVNQLPIMPTISASFAF